MEVSVITICIDALTNFRKHQKTELTKNERKYFYKFKFLEKEYLFLFFKGLIIKENEFLFLLFSQSFQGIYSKYLATYFLKNKFVGDI